MSDDLTSKYQRFYKVLQFIVSPSVNGPDEANHVQTFLNLKRGLPGNFTLDDLMGVREEVGDALREQANEHYRNMVKLSESDKTSVDLEYEIRDLKKEIIGLKATINRQETKISKWDSEEQARVSKLREENKNKITKLKEDHDEEIDKLKGELAGVKADLRTSRKDLDAANAKLEKAAANLAAARMKSGRGTKTKAVKKDKDAKDKENESKELDYGISKMIAFGWSKMEIRASVEAYLALYVLDDLDDLDEPDEDIAEQEPVIENLEGVEDIAEQEPVIENLEPVIEPVAVQPELPLDLPSLPLSKKQMQALGFLKAGALPVNHWDTKVFKMTTEALQRRGLIAIQNGMVVRTETPIELAKPKEHTGRGRQMVNPWTEQEIADALAIERTCPLAKGYGRFAWILDTYNRRHEIQRTYQQLRRLYLVQRVSFY